MEQNNKKIILPLILLLLLIAGGIWIYSLSRSCSNMSIEGIDVDIEEELLLKAGESIHLTSGGKIVYWIVDGELIEKSSDFGYRFNPKSAGLRKNRLNL